MTALRCALHRRRPDRSSRHAASCLRCQAVEARHRQMLRGLRAMRDEEDAAPDGLLLAVMGALDVPVTEPRPATRRVAIAGGTAVAIAAAAAIAGIRHRRAA